MPGFPIRTSSDQRFVGNSPRHNAASHVLHRLSMPRHPPYALVTKQQHTTKTNKQTNNHHTNKAQQSSICQANLQSKNSSTRIKMLASTIQFSHNTPHTPTTNQTSRRSTRGIIKTTQLLPQTPNSAPTHNNIFFRLHNSHARTPPPQQQHTDASLPVAGVSPPGNNIGSHTLGDSTNKKQPTTVSHNKINSLERR